MQYYNIGSFVYMETNELRQPKKPKVLDRQITISQGLTSLCQGVWSGLLANATNGDPALSIALGGIHTGGSFTTGYGLKNLEHINTTGEKFLLGVSTLMHAFPSITNTLLMSQLGLSPALISLVTTASLAVPLVPYIEQKIGEKIYSKRVKAWQEENPGHDISQAKPYMSPRQQKTYDAVMERGSIPQIQNRRERHVMNLNRNAYKDKDGQIRFFPLILPATNNDVVGIDPGATSNTALHNEAGEPYKIDF